MNDKYEFLPDVSCVEISDNNNCIETGDNNNIETVEVIENSPCPCCDYLTIPNKGYALAYICPICMWEIDLFINSDDESSDQNHGLSIKEARENYKKYGAAQEILKQYCREPKDYERVK